MAEDVSDLVGRIGARATSTGIPNFLMTVSRGSLHLRMLHSQSVTMVVLRLRFTVMRCGDLSPPESGTNVHVVFSPRVLQTVPCTASKVRSQHSRKLRLSSRVDRGHSNAKNESLESVCREECRLSWRCLASERGLWLHPRCGPP